MTTINISTEKKVYTTPKVERIELDNEISLQLESAPTPDSGDEVMNHTPEYFNNDPYYKA